MYPFNEIGIEVWALFVVVSLATVVVWGIISWAIVTILRCVDARGSRGSREPPSSGSGHSLASNDVGAGPIERTIPEIHLPRPRPSQFCGSIVGAGGGLKSLP